jgi:hypothetical protein
MVLGDEAVDGALEIDGGAEYAVGIPRLLTRLMRTSLIAARFLG